MAQLSSVSDGEGTTSSVAPSDTTDLTFAARTPKANEAAHSAWLEWKPVGASEWYEVTGSLVDLAETASGVASVQLPNGAEIRAHVRGGGADCFL